MSKNTFFKLFANCIPMQGDSESLIVDFQRGDIYKINNQLFDVLQEVEYVPLYEIKEQSTALYEQLLDFEGLELGFFTTCPEDFPSLNTDWDTPAEISNTIFAVSNHNIALLPSVLADLTVLGCRNLVLQFDDLLASDKLYECIKHVVNYPIFHLELWLLTKPTTVDLEKLIEDFPIIRKIRMLNSEEKSWKYMQSHLEYFTYKKFDDLCKNESCSLCINYEFYCESTKYNNCLNRKLTIDAKGDMKNCLYMHDTFGNIADKQLITTVRDPSFQQLWTLNKNEIEVCGTCEYKYICFDCRAFTTKGAIQSQPLGCFKENNLLA